MNGNPVLGMLICVFAIAFNLITNKLTGGGPDYDNPVTWWTTAFVAVGIQELFIGRLTALWDKFIKKGK